MELFCPGRENLSSLTSARVCRRIVERGYPLEISPVKGLGRVTIQVLFPSRARGWIRDTGGPRDNGLRREVNALLLFHR